MKQLSFILSIVLTVALAALSSGAGAAELSTDKNPRKEASFSAFIQFWGLLETNENSKQQNLSGDLASDYASGFSINRARVAITGDYNSLAGRLSIGFEDGTPFLLDCYGSWSWFKKHLSLVAGQMKIPSTWEVARSSKNLDFITRSAFSSAAPDWSLSRGVSTVSPLTSSRSRLRDTGIALKGNFAGAAFFAMVGNGLGANMYIGGDTNKQFVYANNPGAWFYAMRLEWSPLKSLGLSLPGISRIIAGGHGSYNFHPDFLYNDGNTVLDINRYSWSADFHIDFFQRLRVTAMYGAGKVNDDFDHDGRTDLSYKGWEVRAVVKVIPHTFEAGARYDWYSFEKIIFGGEEETHTITGGLTWIPVQLLRLQANYMFKAIGGSSSRYQKDHIVLLQLQVQI